MEQEALITEPIPEETEQALPADGEGMNDTSAAELPGESEKEPDADARFAELERLDLAALGEALPELASLPSLSALSSPARYGELREIGLSPVEAYLATEGRRLLTRPRDTRGHLQSSVGRTASTAQGRLGSAELAAARDLFPALSDGEIEALWRRVENPRVR